jgi:hypothetical protein
MSHDEFKDLVRRMRSKQKEYFRGGRVGSVLNECKDLERRVDDVLADKTPDLFAGGQDEGEGCSGA